MSSSEQKPLWFWPGVILCVVFMFIVLGRIHDIVGPAVEPEDQTSLSVDLNGAKCKVLTSTPNRVILDCKR